MIESLSCSGNDKGEEGIYRKKGSSLRNVLDDSETTGTANYNLQTSSFTLGFAFFLLVVLCCCVGLSVMGRCCEICSQ